PGSWHSATRYATCFLAALDSALGVDFGLSNMKGFDRAGRFRMYLASPIGRTFHVGDMPDESAAAPEMFWLARRFNQPALSWHEQRAIEKSARAEPLDLVWYQREARAPSSPAWPLDAVFSGVQYASFRSAWDDPNALFLAVKGGDNRIARAHPDLGAFVLDAGGVRWAGGSGGDDANPPSIPGSFRGPNRMRTESFSTILIDGENQDSRAEARITRHEFTPDLSWVQIDLSRAYPAKVKLLQRRIGMVQRRAVMINDRLKSDQPVEALWGMITGADVSFDGQSASLQKDGWTLSAEIRTPRHAVFDILPAQNARDRRLVVRLGEKVSDLDLNVLLVPYKTGQPKPRIVARFPE
ncbi:MAG: heparinase II/III-family protein, partial [Acidobacteriota bacterium]|nr:heparinase II/III-family protein [Acidobacteriota bacterium]